MAQKKKTIADYQDAFKRLFREMENELGAKASEVRIYAREVYPDIDTGFAAVIKKKKQRVTVCNILFSEETTSTIF